MEDAEKKTGQQGLTVRIIKHLFINLYTLCYEVVFISRTKKAGYGNIKGQLVLFQRKERVRLAGPEQQQQQQPGLLYDIVMAPI